MTDRGEREGAVGGSYIMNIIWALLLCVSGVSSLQCTRSYDGGNVVDRPDECQPWSPVCKSTGYCTPCTGSFSSDEAFKCTRGIPYCQKSNGRCKYCTSDSQCLSPVYSSCRHGSCEVPLVPEPTPVHEVPLKTPPPSFIGKEIVSMANWFPENAVLSEAMLDYEDDGSRDSWDYAMFSLVDVLADDDSLPVLQGLKDNGDPKFLELEAKASILREGGCNSARRPNNGLSEEVKLCLCDNESIFLHCEAKMEREFWEGFLEVTEGTDRRQLGDRNLGVVSDIDNFLTILPDIIDTWVCFQKDTPLDIVDCLRDTEEIDLVTEKCVEVEEKCKAVSATAPFFVACLKLGYCLPDITGTETEMKMCPFDKFFDVGTPDSENCAVLAYDQWNIGTIKRELFTRASIKITADLSLDSEEFLNQAFNRDINSEEKDLADLIIEKFDIDLEIASGTVELWPLTQFIRSEFKTNPVFPASIYMGVEAQEGDSSGLCAGMDDCADVSRGMNTCQMCDGESRGIASFILNFAFWADYEHEVTLTTGEDRRLNVSNRRMFLDDLKKVIPKIKKAVVKEVRKIDIIDDFMDFVEEQSKSVVKVWPSEDEWEICGKPTCGAECNGNYGSDVSFPCGSSKTYCNREGKCEDLVFCSTVYGIVQIDNRCVNTNEGGCDGNDGSGAWHHCGPDKPYCNRDGECEDLAFCSTVSTVFLVDNRCVTIDDDCRVCSV
ncbi:unnamed protein product [Ectocarpus sp. 12 AP-2014]